MHGAGLTANQEAQCQYERSSVCLCLCLVSMSMSILPPAGPWIGLDPCSALLDPSWFQACWTGGHCEGMKG